MAQAEASAFDGMAQGYDAEFTATALGKVLRAMVWTRLEERFAGREYLLDIGCGTGEDAVHLARRGHRLLAIDGSAQMVHVARAKAERAGVADRIRFACVSMEHLATELAGEMFDGTYANFGAMNCTADLKSVAKSLAPHLAPGAPLVWVVMGRLVPWEWAWYLARGQARKAFRRLNRNGTSWRGLTISYPTPAALERVLQADFVRQATRSLGFALPPSYAGAWLERAPRALRALTRIEHAAQRWSGSASLADHYIFEALRRS